MERGEDPDIKAMKDCIISRKEFEKRTFPQRSTLKDAAFLLLYGTVGCVLMVCWYYLTR